MYPENGATHKYQPKWLDRMKTQERDVGGAVVQPQPPVVTPAQPVAPQVMPAVGGAMNESGGQ